MAMQTAVPAELLALQDRLAKITMDWSANRRLDEPEAARLRRRAAELCHEHYRATIPYYRKVCERMKVTGPASFDTIVDRLLVPDDIFKSYPQRYLDEGRYDQMNEWVSAISSATIRFDTAGIGSLDEWIDRVERAGLRLVFSSGTSGHVSFVPRDAATWDAFTGLPFLYAASSMGHRGLLPGWKFALLKLLAARLAPAPYAALIRRVGLRSLDGYLLNFSGGNQGVQLVGQELAKLTRAAHFLYEKKMSAAAVRAIIRGPRTPDERKLADEFLDTTVRRKTQSYERIVRLLEQSVARGHKLMLFGTPALMMELCQVMERRGLRLQLPDGSAVAYGGGWKSLSGNRVSEEELVALIGRTFGVTPNAVSDGYSMTEINGLMQKCPHGRYHVPPFLEPIVYDEDLSPRRGLDVRGTLGFVDPFALSYPGFVLTGDNVRLLRTPCACGLPGPAILRIERSPGKDVKGCGGIMATVNA
jgi:hypothetical protein